jgi:hypothetical protein
MSSGPGEGDPHEWPTGEATPHETLNHFYGDAIRKLGSAEQIKVAQRFQNEYFAHGMEQARETAILLYQQALENSANDPMKQAHILGQRYNIFAHDFSLGKLTPLMLGNELDTLERALMTAGEQTSRKWRKQAAGWVETSRAAIQAAISLNIENPEETSKHLVLVGGTAVEGARIKSPEPNPGAA